jgi:DNA primase
MGSNITKTQLNTLKKLIVKNILLFFDSDTAGNSAQREVEKALKGCLFRVICIKDYMGCNDPAEAFEQGELKNILLKAEKEAV